MTLPPDGRRSAHWTAKAEEVEAAQGEWVLVAENVSSGVPYRITHGNLAAFRPTGRFEVTTRKRDPNRNVVDVWVRLIDS